MNLEIIIGIFMSFCAGIGALKVIISSVKNCINQGMEAVMIRLDRLEKDTELLSGIDKKVFSKEDLQQMIDLAIAKHKNDCQNN